MRRHLRDKVMENLVFCKTLIYFWLCSIHSTIHAESGRANRIFDSLNDQFSKKSAAKDQQFGEFFLVLIAGAVLIFVIWLAYQFIMSRKKNSSPDTAWGLYKKLCRVHRLSMKERFVIHKVYRHNGLDDPLPLFVEPNYFKQVLADETMSRYHATVQDILQKLYGSDQALPQKPTDDDEMPQEILQEIKMDENSLKKHNTEHAEFETVGAVEDDPGEVSEDSSIGRFEEYPSFAGGENPSSAGTKVLLNPIPGRMAFSSLVEPFRRLSTEIAAVSIQHNLSDGRGMNERTFDAMSEQRIIHPEPQSPLFPKSNVPSPDEMLVGDSRRTDRHSSVSPTPRYLRYKDTSTDGITRRPSDYRLNQNATSPRLEEVVSLDGIARMETIVVGK
ncbi:MAG: hypothetical protein FWH27_00545 [Planctomycetaceae bacterium]|nr:hypothetical protein [Planctomycetaceae bacterium]